MPPATPALHVRLADGQLQPLDEQRLAREIDLACAGLDGVSPEAVMVEVHRNLYDGILEHEVGLAQTMAARSLVEQEPNYAFVSARLLLNILRDEALRFVLPESVDKARQAVTIDYAAVLSRPTSARPSISRWSTRSSPPSTSQRLAAALIPEPRRELPVPRPADPLRPLLPASRPARASSCPRPSSCASRWVSPSARSDREARAIEFYELLSSFDFMCSTPTLFNAGTLRPQLSSCFLTTIEDDLAGIFKAIKDNALLSKYAGGLGNDWSAVRGLGSHIKGTNGQSQGLVPFLKVANDTAIAVNQGGKRKGAVCGYLETWHIDIEEFLDLRKNTGDDRRRTHDMNTANWVPDLFMQRVEEDGQLDPLLARRDPRSARSLRPCLRRTLRLLRSQGRTVARCSVTRTVRARRSLAPHAHHDLRDRSSLDHLQGSLQPPLSAAARRRRAFVEPLHRDHAEHHRPARSPFAISARSISPTTSPSPAWTWRV